MQRFIKEKPSHRGVMVSVNLLKQLVTRDWDLLIPGFLGFRLFNVVKKRPFFNRISLALGSEVSRLTASLVPVPAVWAFATASYYSIILESK